MRNLDRLIASDQGEAFEVIVLIRFVPLPTGVSQYFLGTTSVTWGPFLGANAVVSLFFACTDTMIGMGAARLRPDDPVFVVAFALGLCGFLGGMAWLGCNAKRKLDALNKQPGTHVRRYSIDNAFLGDSDEESETDGDGDQLMA